MTSTQGSGPAPSAGPSPIPRPAESASRALHPSHADTPVLDSEVLSQIVTGMASAVEEVPQVAEGAIQRIRLLATEGYDAWLMVWGPGATLASHDHGASIGVMHLVSGELLETHADLADAEMTPLRALAPGDVSEFPAGFRHALLNPGRAVAVTLSAFSPPVGGSSGRAPV